MNAITQAEQWEDCKRFTLLAVHTMKTSGTRTSVNTSSAITGTSM